MRQRHLAGAKAVDADLALEVVELAVELRGEVAGGNHHVVSPLEPFAQRFRHLHVRPTVSRTGLRRGRIREAACARSGAPAAAHWCGRRDSNPHDCSLEPKSSASTSSATPALSRPVARPRSTHERGSIEGVGCGRQRKNACSRRHRRGERNGEKFARQRGVGGRRRLGYNAVPAGQHQRREHRRQPQKQNPSAQV